jgi:hypothetical protein
MNQTVDNAIGGYDAARNTVPLNGGTTQNAEPSGLAFATRTSRDGLGDNCEHGTVQVAAQNIAASRITPEEIRMLLEPSNLRERWDGKERRFYKRRDDANVIWRLGQPRPNAERRVRKDRRKHDHT